MFALPDRGRCQCVRAEIVCAKAATGMVHKPGMSRYLVHSANSTVMLAIQLLQSLGARHFSRRCKNIVLLYLSRLCRPYVFIVLCFQCYVKSIIVLPALFLT